MRGEGLLLGLRCVMPNGQLVDALRDEHLLAVAAGDNVVRLVPPLIVSEAEVGDAMGMLDRACARLARAAEAREAGSRRVSAPAPRHFLDLTEIPVAELRGMIEASRAMKDQRQARPRRGRTSRSPARRWR